MVAYLGTSGQCTIPCKSYYLERMVFKTLVFPTKVLEQFDSSFNLSLCLTLTNRIELTLLVLICIINLLIINLRKMHVSICKDQKILNLTKKSFKNKYILVWSFGQIVGSVSDR